MFSECFANIVFYRPKQGAIEIILMFCLIEILGDEPLGFEANRYVAHFVAFAMHAKVEHAFALLQIAYAKLAEFLTAQAVIQQCGEDRAVTFAFERVGWRCLKQHTRLLVTERRCEARASAFDLSC